MHHKHKMVHVQQFGDVTQWCIQADLTELLISNQPYWIGSLHLTLGNFRHHVTDSSHSQDITVTTIVKIRWITQKNYIMFLLLDFACSFTLSFSLFMRFDYPLKYEVSSLLLTEIEVPIRMLWQKVVEFLKTNLPLSIHYWHLVEPFPVK